MFRVFTNDENYDKIESELIKRKKKGESITMCTFVEEIMNKGKAEGIQQGKEEAKIELAINLLSILPDAVIAEKAELDIKVVEALRKEHETSSTQ